MDVLKDNIKHVYLRYFMNSFGSVFMTSIYAIVDMAVVGQYQGPTGSAAMAIAAPIWNIIYSLALLTSIGGSILYAHSMGAKDEKRAKMYYTTSFVLTSLLSLTLWFITLFFDKQLLYFFGCNDTLLPYCLDYLLPIKICVPVFLMSQFLTSFLRNDNDPFLATVGVLAGGIFNIVGDYVFVFIFDMGIFGAGLASTLGVIFGLFVMLTHFLKPTNHLHLIRIKDMSLSLKIITTGVSSFVLDLAMGILNILFNKEILMYFNSDALAVYGVILNISTFVQCCGYAVGGSAQPVMSMNLGAKQYDRVNQVVYYAKRLAFILGVLWILIIMLLPTQLIYIFMKPNANVLKIGPLFLRLYGLSFLLLPFNIFSTFYFQAKLKPKISFLISITRGILLSGLLIIVLPLIHNYLLWLAMPLTELLIFIYAYKKMESS